MQNTSWRPRACHFSLLQGFLSPDTQTRLRRLGRRVNCARGELLSRYGDDNVTLVTSGWVRVTRYTATGSALHRGPFGRGRFLGLEQVLCESEAPPEVRALGAVQAMLWSVEALRELARSEPGLEQGAGHVLAEALEEARHEQLEAHELGPTQRLARLLARFAEPLGEFQGALPVTQTDLAALLGVRRETVCAHMARLERDGLLERRGRALQFDTARLLGFARAL